MTRLESTCMHSSGHVRVCLTKSPFLNGNRKEPHWKSQIRTRKAGITKIPALPAFPPAVLSSQELSQLFSSGGHPILAGECRFLQQLQYLELVQDAYAPIIKVLLVSECSFWNRFANNR
jgi:hypothetical protein